MRRLVLGGLLVALAACGDGGGVEATEPDAQQLALQGGAAPGYGNVPPPGPQGGPPMPPQGGGAPMGPQGGAQPVVNDQAQQALQGLYGIRQQQCQMGNQLACQSLGEFQGHSQQLAQAGQACRTGDQQACGAHNSLSQRIFQAYSESAAVMQSGAQASAQMNAWRNQMNNNHANNMARLNAQAAAGQAAHQARQESYAAQNQAWRNGQASQERNVGRFNDAMREGTTMSGGGAQTFVPHGSTAYTDQYGNVAVGAEGGDAPDGWTPMTPTYGAPD